MISDKLFGLVMNYEGSYQDYTTEQIMDDEYPLAIYNLAHMCKMWALTQNCSIMSTFKHTLGHARVEWYEKGHKDKFGQIREFSLTSEWFKADTEADAIFKACSWILGEDDE